MIAVIKPNTLQPEVVKGLISQELGKWGLELKEAKTRTSKTEDGFNFLGWNFKVLPDGRFKSTPSKDNYRKFRKKVKDIVNCSTLSTADKVSQLSKIVRGWRNYHRHCDMSGHSLWHLNHAVWKQLRRDKNSSRKKANELIGRAFPSIGYSENRHIKVQGERSPYDGDIIYWSERNSKLYDGLTAQLLKKQDYKCGCCGYKLTSDERVHLHHINGNHRNWEKKNLTVIHESCHDYIHIGKTAR